MLHIMSAYSGEFWHVCQNIYFNFLAQKVWEASKNKVPFCSTGAIVKNLAPNVNLCYYMDLWTLGSKL